jgi:hypothetical protein
MTEEQEQRRGIDPYVAALTSVVRENLATLLSMFEEMNVDGCRITMLIRSRYCEDHQIFIWDKGHQHEPLSIYMDRRGIKRHNLRRDLIEIHPFRSRTTLTLFPDDFIRSMAFQVLEKSFPDHLEADHAAATVNIDVSGRFAICQLDIITTMHAETIKA